MVGSVDLAGGRWLPLHTHPAHQLSWAAHGVLTVRVADGPGGGRGHQHRARTWVLPPTLALWIPARRVHTIGAPGGLGQVTMRGLYLQPESCPVTWSEPTVTAVGPLLRELITYLARGDLAADARARAEAVVPDQLRPVSATTIDVPVPTDERVRRVAEALTADPADGRSLEAWGRVVGASGRTLARLFLADTGLTFGSWRAQLRLRAALPELAAGTPVGVVARRVGYATPSAFVAAFRRAVGVSPGAYFPTQETGRR